MAKFDFYSYLNASPKMVNMISDDVFDIVIGTKRMFYNDIMDMAGQTVLQKVRFSLSKKDSACKAATAKGDTLFLTDEQDLKLKILLNNIEYYFQNCEFSPKSFCSFARFILRPLSVTDKMLSQTRQKKIIPLMQTLPNSIIQILLKERTTNTTFSIDPNKVLPRYKKSKLEQKSRTNKKAEVFTPYEIVKQMNDQFETTFDGSFLDYIKKTVLEVTCGEAPYLTSRYDAATGNDIAVKDRIGLLDRKLQCIPNVPSDEWIGYATMALKATYGYEWQEDSILIARKNLVLTTIEHYYDRYGQNPNETVLQQWAEIVSYNIIQMDGITMCIPNTNIPSKLMNWETNQMERFDNKNDNEKYGEE